MFGLGPIRRWLTHHTEPAPSAAGLNLTASDVDDLTMIGARVASEYGVSSPAVLSATLTRLIRRQVPVRGLHAAEVRSIGGLHFADGTVVLVRGRHAGDLGRIAAGIHFGGARLADFHADREGVVLELVYGGRHEHLSALGTTQPV